MQKWAEVQIAINELEYKVKALFDENHELVTQQRNKEEFISMISHDLKNPLTPILAFSGMLEKRAKVGTQLSENDVKSIQIINQSAKEMKQLIDDLLSVYKLELNVQFSFSTTNLQALIEEVLLELSPILADKGISVETRYTGKEKPFVTCDQLRVKQLMINLVKNAIDFVPSQTGKITVTAENTTIASVPAGLQGPLPPSYEIVLVTVSDNGIGIPAEKVPKLFRKFYQVDPKAVRRHGGTGLGLMICKGIVEAHKGKIWYDPVTAASNGGGACFKFFLPRMQQTPPNEQ